MRIADLPDDTVYQITRHLHILKLCTLSESCHKFSTILSTPEAWKPKLLPATGAWPAVWNKICTEIPSRILDDKIRTPCVDVKPVEKKRVAILHLLFIYAIRALRVEYTRSYVLINDCVSHVGTLPDNMEMGNVGREWKRLETVILGRCQIGTHLNGITIAKQITNPLHTLIHALGVVASRPQTYVPICVKRYRGDGGDMMTHLGEQIYELRRVIRRLKYTYRFLAIHDIVLLA